MQLGKLRRECWRRGLERAGRALGGHSLHAIDSGSYSYILAREIAFVQAAAKSVALDREERVRILPNFLRDSQLTRAVIWIVYAYPQFPAFFPKCLLLFSILGFPAFIVIVPSLPHHRPPRHPPFRPSYITRDRSKEDTYHRTSIMRSPIGLVPLVLALLNLSLEARAAPIATAGPSLTEDTWASTIEKGSW